MRWSTVFYREALFGGHMREENTFAWSPDMFKTKSGEWVFDAFEKIFSCMEDARVEDPTGVEPSELYDSMLEYESLVKVTLLYLEDHPDTERARALCRHATRIAFRLFGGIGDEAIIRIAVAILFFIGEKYRQTLLDFISVSDPCAVHPSSAIIIIQGGMDLGREKCTICELVIEQ